MNRLQICTRGGITLKVIVCALLMTLTGMTTVSAGNVSLGKEVKPSSTKLLQPLKLPGLATKEKNATKSLLKKAPKVGLKDSATLPKVKSPFKSK